MRILIVSFFFPPYNAIGAVRLGKMAKYLHLAGHDVRILTAAPQALQATLPLEVPAERVVATRWLDVNRPAEWLFGGRERVAARGYAGSRSGTAGAAKSLYRALLHVPDAQVGWVPSALTAGRRLLRSWRPDVIYASSSPLSALVVARGLAKRHGIPWVAELRDLWADNPYAALPLWRRRLDDRLERRVLRDAAVLVTVSEPLAKELAAKTGKPVHVVTNGFDASDYPAPHPSPARGSGLRICYTGVVYEGKRDPTPLFRALRLMGRQAARVRVAFYGRYLAPVREAAEREGVAHLVETHDQVAYGEALRLQCEADALLFLCWDDPREAGYLTGKLFEYLGARRPILSVGGSHGAAVQLIRERRAGVVLREPGEIAGQLEAWLLEKAEKGHIAPLPASAADGFTRREQAAKLEAVLRGVAGKDSLLAAPMDAAPLPGVPP